jgi:putative tryptophan/tyrosine transport system substrate-binding protein
VTTRREFVVGVAMLLGHPLATDAQTAKVYRIGILTNYPLAPFFRDPFLATLRDLGYVEGRNIVLEARSANNLAERLPGLASELVRLNVDVIVTGGDAEVAAAKQATTLTPIVMAPSGDPVRAGYVASLARPGGNITGVSFRSPDVNPKLLEILKAAIPNLSRVAVLWNSANPVKVFEFDETRRAAQARQLTIVSIEVKAIGDLEDAFAAISRARPDALFILVDQLLSPVIRPRIAQFAMRQRLPSVAANSGYAAAGGLIGYGPSTQEIYEIAAGQVAKILRGVSPRDLPVEQPSRLEFIINLKTAKAVGVTIPQSLLLRADQLIE